MMLERQLPAFKQHPKNVNKVLTCGSCKETNLSMIDLRTPVAASRKSSSSQTKPLPKVEEEQTTQVVYRVAQRKRVQHLEPIKVTTM